MTTRNDFSPKFRGIYDKAMTGRSPKASVQCCCLVCMSSKTKEIRDCTDTGCQHHPYRPYQENPHKSHRPTNPSILSRSAKGKIAKSSPKSGGVRKYTHFIQNVPEGRVRIRIEIEPKPEKEV